MGVLDYQSRVERDPELEINDGKIFYRRTLRSGGGVYVLIWDITKKEKY